MKTIITLTDMPDGSVNIDVITQMTKEEAARGMQPHQSPSYQCAHTFKAVVSNAKALAHEMRLMHAEAIEKAEYGPCLH